jgi:misacylated tRNA(Ala) deacylase
VVRYCQDSLYPGGGGQRHDSGYLILHGDAVAVSAIREDAAGRIWDFVGCDLASAKPCEETIDWPFRYALMHHHGLTHIVNTIARRQFGGIITSVQIGRELISNWPVFLAGRFPTSRISSASVPFRK